MHIIAKILSYLFHPILIPTYAIYFLVRATPELFGPWPSADAVFIVQNAVLNSFFYPLFAVFLLKQLGFIEGYEAKTRKDRIFIMIPTFCFFLHTFIVYYQSEFAILAPDVMLGATVALAVAFFVYAILGRISLHAIGMGGLFATVLFAANIASKDLTIPLLATILIAGAVGSARLILNAHTTREVYNGYMVGFLCMAFSLIF